MRLACVAPFAVHSGIDHAGGEYLFRYLGGLGELGWKIDLIVLDTAGNRNAAERARDELPRTSVVFRSETARAPIDVKLAYPVRGMVSMHPRRWATLPGPAEALARADVLDLQWYHSYCQAARFRSFLPHTPVVATVHDLESSRLALALRVGRKGLKAEAALGWLAVRRAEAEALNACDQFYAFKSADLDAAARLGVRTIGAVTAPAVWSPQDGPVPAPRSRRLVFPGAMWREENYEAALWFLDRVWPEVLLRHPDAVLVIAGSKPPEILRKRASPNVVVTGYLAVFTDAFQDALGVVAPLRRGVGLKFKVAQAVALGFPVIGTSVAFAGLEDFVSAPPAPADTPAELRRQVLELLDAPQRFFDAARHRAAEINASLDFDAAVQRRSDDYERLIPRSRA